MKTETTKNKRVEVRLNEEDYKLLKICATTMGMTSSRLIRMYIDSTISGLKLKIKKGELNIEDFETILND